MNNEFNANGTAVLTEIETTLAKLMDTLTPLSEEKLNKVSFEEVGPQHR